MTRLPTTLFSSLVLTVITGLLTACGVISVPDDVCTLYCNKVMETCGEFDPVFVNNGQYTTNAACKVYCQEASRMPTGNPDDENVNSAQCRLHHAELAALDPDTHCQHAGPTGGNVCGNYCDTYCQLMASNCDGKFADTAACNDACRNFGTEGLANDNQGDTVQCRITYAGLAGTERGGSASIADCNNAMPDSPFCSVPADCGSFCTEVLATCTGNDSHYADQADCLATCSQAGGWTPGTLGDTDFSSIGCRHAATKRAAAETDAAAKTALCLDASETGGDTCGTYCDVFCEALEKNCPGEFGTFADFDACFDACQPLAKTGAPNDLTGNTVQCRLSYALSAGLPENAGAVDTVCGSASIASPACQ